MRKLIIIILGVVLVLNFLMVKNVQASNTMEISIFMPGATDNISFLTNFETDLGIKFNSARFYMDWSDNYAAAAANRLHSNGTIPDMTWQPQVNGVGVNFNEVLAGKYDDYILDVARTVKSLGYEVRICLGPEMNGDWSTWGVLNPNNGPENQKLFWRYVVGKFRSEGVTNAKWIWAPNVHFWGEKYQYANIFPGDEYLDYVGLEGYNWGASQSWSEWQTFDEVFASSYADLVAISGKEVFITEIGSAEAGGNKAAWIKDMFAGFAQKYPRVKGFTWFNILKETDWRINSSAESRLAFIEGVNSVPTVTPPTSPISSSGNTTSNTTGNTKKSSNNKIEKSSPNLLGKNINYVKTDEQVQEEVQQAIQSESQDSIAQEKMENRYPGKESKVDRTLNLVIDIISYGFLKALWFVT